MSGARAAAEGERRVGRWAAPTLGVAVCLAAAWFGQASLGGRVADADSFYHLAHADLYLEGSVLNTELPWAAHSVIGDGGGDLWWGFHLVLLPFAAAFPGVPGAIAASGVVLTALLLVTLLGVLRSSAVRWPLLWTLLAFAAVPNALYRLLMVRPHLLSMAAGLALAALLARGRWRGAAVAAAALAWIHASLFWMAGVILLAHLAARALAERRAGGRPLTAGVRPALLAVVGGTAAGLLLRPAPWATLGLVRVQLLEFLQARGEADLRFGGELTPLPLPAFLASSWLLLLPWLVGMAGIVLAWRRVDPEAGEPDETPVLATTLALVSALFLALALLLAARAQTEWAVFGAAAAALGWPLALRGAGVRRTATAMLAAAALAAAPWLLQWHRANVRLNAVEPDYLREVATWLADNSSPGDLVFHAHWDNFGPLLAWNRTNHYLGGMDPVFQYAHAPERYAAIPALLGRGPLGRDPWEVIAEGYAPRWVLVEPFRDPALYEALRTDPRWDLARLTRSEAVFAAVAP